MIKATRFIGLSCVTLLFSALFISCATTSGRHGESTPKETPRNVSLEKSFSSESGRLWTCLPTDGNPVFFGISANRYSEEDELQKALEYAADQASKYYRIKGEAGLLDTRKGQMSYTQVDFDHDLATQLKDKLEVIDKYHDYKGTYILVKLKGASAPDVTYNPASQGGFSGMDPPEWISKAPKIPGYLTAVGIVQKSYELPDSIRRADEQAFTEIINQISLKVKGGLMTREVENGGEVNKRVSSQVAAAELEGFYILARWHSQDGRYFYSLAICPESNRK